jgi:hypothetical protein
MMLTVLQRGGTAGTFTVPAAVSDSTSQWLGIRPCPLIEVASQRPTSPGSFWLGAVKARPKGS